MEVMLDLPGQEALPDGSWGSVKKWVIANVTGSKVPLEAVAGVTKYPTVTGAITAILTRREEACKAGVTEALSDMDWPSVDVWRGNEKLRIAGMVSSVRDCLFCLTETFGRTVFHPDGGHEEETAKLQMLEMCFLRVAEICKECASNIHNVRENLVNLEEAQRRLRKTIGP